MVIGVVGLTMLAGLAAGTMDVAPALAAEGEGTVTGDVDPTEALTCEPGTVYTMGASGSLNKVVPGPTAVTSSKIATFAAASPGLELNGLALTQGGAYAYAVADALDNGAVTVYRYDPELGVTTAYPGATGVPDPAAPNDTTFVLGGIDPVSGIYYYGRLMKVVTNTTTFLEIYAFDTQETTSIGYVGKVAVGVDSLPSARSSGDLVFDMSGRMHFVASSGGTVLNASVLMTVNEPLPRVATTAATAPLAATRLGDYLELNLAANGGSGGRVGRRVNGIAFAEGSLYVSTFAPSTGFYRYFKVNASARKAVNSNFGNVIGSSAEWAAPVGLPVDMATCQYNNSLTVQKNVVRRFASGDQFAVRIFSGGSATATSLGTTSGSGLGLQTDASATAYSLPLGGTAIRISENATAASDGNLSNYTSTYVCTDQHGTVIRDANDAEVRGTGITTSFAFPPQTLNGVHVTCVFTNTPKTAHVTVKKTWVGAFSGDVATFTANTETGTSTAPATDSEVISADFDQGSAVTVAEAMSPSNRGTSYTQALACKEDVSGAAVTVVAGKFTLGAEDVTCVFTNTNTSASVVVDKKWIVDGVAYDNDAQPAGIAAALTLTGPAGDDATTPTWGKVRSGYAAGNTVNINETTSIDEALINCTLTDAKVTRANGTTVAVGLTSDYSATLVAGANSYTITNTVACQARLTLLKLIDSTNGGTLKPSNFTLTATSESGNAVGVPGVDTVPVQAVPVNTMDVAARSPYALSESSSADLAYVRIGLQRYTGTLTTDGNLADPTAWEDAASSVSVETGQHEVYRFVNASVPRLNLPLTGGTGPARYLLAGGGMLLAAFLIAAWIVWRRIQPSLE